MSDDLKNFGLNYLKTKADLQFSLSKALNTILQKFRGRDQITVSEVHQTLRDLGVDDYSPADFQFIEERLKRYGVLVVPG